MQPAGESQIPPPAARFQKRHGGRSPRGGRRVFGRSRQQRAFLPIPSRDIRYDKAGRSGVLYEAGTAWAQRGMNKREKGVGSW